MKKYKIYRIINDLNEKVYIGFTTKSLIWRLAKHINEAKRQYFPNRKIYKAINEIGADHFSIELLYDSNDKDKTLNQKEQYYIELYDSINNGYNSRKGGGGSHLTTTQHKPVDVYNKDHEFINTFPSRAAAAEFIGCDSALISIAVRNADNKKGSQVHGYWVCHVGSVPCYKTSNTTTGRQAAIASNTGKKRPEHSKLMKAKMNQIHCNYHTPSGTYTLSEGGKIWGRDFLIAWCNHPEQQITEMMIRKSKKLNLSDHQHWIGKTKREMGFYRT